MTVGLLEFVSGIEFCLQVLTEMPYVKHEDVRIHGVAFYVVDLGLIQFLKPVEIWVFFCYRDLQHG